MSGTTREGGYYTPDIEYISKSYHLKYYKLSITDLDNKDLWCDIRNNRNCIIEYIIEGQTTVSPKLEYNNPIERVSPLLPEDELDLNMQIN
jgi:acetolactate synthase-1/2/3 large subunit